MKAVVVPEGLPPMDPCGWLVLLWEDGAWHDDWDGEVHPTEEAGWAAVSEALAAGWSAVLVRAEYVKTDLSTKEK